MPKKQSDLASLAAVVALLAQLPALVSSSCYFPNGAIESSIIYQPCSDISGLDSMCCALNRENPSNGSGLDGWTKDICLSNGLCLNVIQEPIGNNQTITNTTYWRDMCTSTSWPSSGCIKVCDTGDDAANTVVMTPCDGKEDSTEWCCGFNNTACCGTSAAITLTALGGGSTASAMKAMSSTASSLTASTSSTASSHSSSSLSTGAKAGIGVGVGLGGLSLLSLLAFLFHQRRKPLQASLPSPGGPPEMPATATSQLYEKPVVTSQLHEKPAGANSTRHELMDMSTEN